MELRHLRYFLAAAEELNISRASRRLHVSQPAVSRLIHDLEDELGNPLFVRERFGLALTPAGSVLLGYARQILDLTGEAVRVLGNQPRKPVTITVGFLASALGSFLGAALKSFREAHPEVAINIHELTPAGQVRALARGEIDVALIGNPCGAVHDQFETLVLFDLRLEAAVPAGHSLAGRKSISLKGLEGEPFIGYREESFPGRNQTIVAACRVAGFKPQFAFQADSLVEVLALVGAGAGVCLMPGDVASLSHPGVALVAIKDKLEPIHFTAAWRRDDDRPIVAALLEHAVKQRAPGNG
ncbi:LysR family transcriptional regulator [Geomonas sp. Red32]|uniref:LysR family transcriptional regulator n=1 Tax=Geomonas sp. Red32 TaxID=2912856 RepID=UPI00202CF36D|nr:LysR family transcriptional regulator [Geomonas sp. Red32]MCM0081244.1 LysR family transcriptional regulator [Geomonas sp. Red32]